MRKIIIKIALLFASFFMTWTLLSQVDWISIFRINQLTEKAEKSLGDLFWETLSKDYEEIKNKDILQPVDSILSRICSANKIERKDIKLHIVNYSEVNAFALPDNHLVVYRGLLEKADNENELAGVIGHELAHLRLKHIMKKLTKEIGISTLLSLSTGSTAGEAMRSSLKVLSSTAFDRKYEHDADLLSVEYLANANIDPIPFADFMRKLSINQSEIDLSWISTHPDSEERANYIEEKSKYKHIINHPILTFETWKRMKVSLCELDK